jgi:hypothetical protein
MKSVILLVAVLLLAVPFPSSAQTVSAGTKIVGVSGTNVTFTALDTTLIGTRAIARSGLKYTQAQLDSALLARGSGTYTKAQLDSAFAAGKLVPPDGITLGGGWSPASYTRVVPTAVQSTAPKTQKVK